MSNCCKDPQNLATATPSNIVTCCRGDDEATTAGTCGCGKAS